MDDMIHPWLFSSANWGLRAGESRGTPVLSRIFHDFLFRTLHSFHSQHLSLRVKCLHLLFHWFLLCYPVGLWGQILCPCSLLCPSTSDTTDTVKTVNKYSLNKWITGALFYFTVPVFELRIHLLCTYLGNFPYTHIKLGGKRKIMELQETNYQNFKVWAWYVFRNN